MSSSRMSPASAKQSRASAPGTAGPSLLAHLWQSIAACRQPGWSRSTWVARVGCRRLRPTASGVKNRNASKCVQRIGCVSTTASVPAWPSRSGSEWRCSRSR